MIIIYGFTDARFWRKKMLARLWQLFSVFLAAVQLLAYYSHEHSVFEDYCIGEQIIPEKKRSVKR